MATETNPYRDRQSQILIVNLDGLAEWLIGNRGDLVGQRQNTDWLLLHALFLFA